VRGKACGMANPGTGGTRPWKKQGGGKPEKKTMKRTQKVVVMPEKWGKGGRLMGGQLLTPLGGWKLCEKKGKKVCADPTKRERKEPKVEEPALQEHIVQRGKVYHRGGRCK